MAPDMVTMTFSQHWITVGQHLRVLLLDFDAKFTLLIPNIELGKAFRINIVRAVGMSKSKYYENLRLG